MKKSLLAVVVSCLACNFARGAYYDMELSETASSHRSTVRSGVNCGTSYPAQRVYSVPVFKGETVPVTITFSIAMSGCSSGAFYCFVNGTEMKPVSGAVRTYRFNLTADSTIKVFASAGGGYDYVSAYYSESTYTITATFPMRYTVTYHPGSGGVVGTDGKTGQDISEKYPSGGTATLLADETYFRTGYRQRGWAKSDLGTSLYRAFGASVTMYGNETLYPYWQKVSTYTIRYLPDSNSTGSASSAVKTQGLPVTLLKKAPFTCTDRVQAGWSKTAGGALAYALGEQYTDDANVTLYPYWVDKTSLVTYKPGRQGLGGELTDVKNSGTSLRLPGAIYSRKGYQQCGWTTTDGGAKTHELSGYYGTQESADFYPVWTPDPAADKRYMVIDLSGGSSASQYSVTYLSDVPDGGWTDEYKTSKLVLRMIPNVSNVQAINKTVTHSYMGVFEVTQRQYKMVTGGASASDAITWADMLPATNTYLNIHSVKKNAMTTTRDYTVVDGNSFIGKIRTKTGNQSFDLPTPDAWASACRAGTLSDQGWGDRSLGYDRDNNSFTLDLNKMALYAGNNPQSVGTTKVGSYLPNAWGIYDMIGNAREWCYKQYDVEMVTEKLYYYPICGAGALYSADKCKCSVYGHTDPTRFYNGFRLWCSISEVAKSVYEVTYLPGTSGTGSQVEDAKIQGTSFALRGAIFTRSGYRQWAWQDASGNRYDLGGTYATDANITLYPVWTSDGDGSSSGEAATPDAAFWTKYPKILSSASGDKDAAKMLMSPGKSGKGKYKPNGEPMRVWEDYVAGTNPEDETDLFSANIQIVNGKPQITWSPALNGEGVKTGTRVYRVLGAQSPSGPFAEVPTGSESSCSFFTVSVEMK